MTQLGWVGALRPPLRVQRAARDFGARAHEVWVWGGWPLAVVAGAAPVALSAWTGGSLHQPLTALLAFGLLIGALGDETPSRAVFVLPVVFVAHSVVAIGLVSCGSSVASCFPGGPEYWVASESWIRTGIDPEYDPANWIPEHVQLFGVVFVAGYLTLGVIPLAQGLHEVDMMNYYVGRLLAESHGSMSAFALGWHPWSIARGLGYCVLLYELVAWSFGRLSASAASERHPRMGRLGFAVGLLMLDGVMKLLLLEPVRRALHGGLVGGV
jgi:hypothetical protein